MNTGTVRIDGDNLCENYPTRLNPESCYEVYRVGEDKYELWLQGSLVRTWFSGQAEYNEPKKKDKLPAPEFGDSFIIAGILHKTKTAWIIWAEGEKRELFWRSLANPGFSGSDTTTVRIDGDKECLKWTWGPESCTEAYRTGENSFESWANGDIDSTYFRLK